MKFKKIEDIDVWKRGCRLVLEVYKLSESERLAKDWTLRDQIRRSAISIPSNVAEGFERNSNAEFRRFLLIAKGSCGELRTQIYLAKGLSLVSAHDADALLQECTEVSSMIQNLIVYLGRRTGKS